MPATFAASVNVLYGGVGSVLHKKPLFKSYFCSNWSSSSISEEVGDGGKLSS